MGWLAKETQTRRVYKALIAQPGGHARLRCCASWQRHDDTADTAKRALLSRAWSDKRRYSSSDSSSDSDHQVSRRSRVQWSGRREFKPRGPVREVTYSGRGDYGQETTGPTPAVEHVTLQVGKQPETNSVAYVAVTPRQESTARAPPIASDTKQHTACKRVSPRKANRPEVVTSSPSPEKAKPATVNTVEKLRAIKTGGKRDDSSNVKNLISMFATNAGCPLAPVIKQTTNVYADITANDNRFRGSPYRSRTSHTSSIPAPASRVTSEPFMGVQATIHKLVKDKSSPEQDNEGALETSHGSRQQSHSRTRSRNRRPTHSRKDDDSDHHPRLNDDKSLSRLLDSKKGHRSLHGDKSNRTRLQDVMSSTRSPGNKHSKTHLQGHTSKQPSLLDTIRNQSPMPNTKMGSKSLRVDVTSKHRFKDDKRGTNRSKKDKTRRIRSNLYDNICRLEDNNTEPEEDVDTTFKKRQRESIIGAIKAMKNSNQTLATDSTDAIDRGHCLRPRDLEQGSVFADNHGSVASAKPRRVSSRTPLLRPSACRAGSVPVNREEPELRGLSKVLKMFHRVRRPNAR